MQIINLEMFSCYILYVLSSLLLQNDLRAPSGTYRCGYEKKTLSGVLTYNSLQVAHERHISMHLGWGHTSWTIKTIAILYTWFTSVSTCAQYTISRTTTQTVTVPQRKIFAEFRNTKDLM